jgi:16S rRNA (guanine527-N7)-methyltransferase
VKADQPLKLLERGAAELGVVLSAVHLSQFDRFLAELQKWNRRINLTSANTIEEVITRHILDSLAGLAVLSDLPSGAAVADLGSGAGFPGLPIKIVRPDLDMTLIEPREKRAAFLTTVCALLKLQGLTVVEATLSAKHLPSDLEGRFRGVVMRAVTQPQEARVLATPLLTAGGRIVIWVSEQQVEDLGSEFAVHRYRIPGTNVARALAVAT